MRKEGYLIVFNSNNLPAFGDRLFNSYEAAQYWLFRILEDDSYILDQFSILSQTEYLLLYYKDEYKKHILGE